MKEKSLIRKRVLIVVAALLLVVALTVTLVVVLRKDDKNTAVMQLDANPSISLVLDQNDNVVAEIAINADGEKLLALVSFVGLNAQVAVENFVDMVTKMGKMNEGDAVSTLGSTQITITISASEEDIEKYNELADDAVQIVNKYFSDIGVFAGAVANVNSDIKAAVNKWAIDVRDYANLTTDEILDYAKNTAEKLNQVAIENRDSLSAHFTTLYEQILSTFDEALTIAKEQLDAAANMPQAVKDELQEAFDIALELYNDKKAELDEKFDEFLKTVQEASKSAFERIKTEAQAAYDASIELYNQAVEAFTNKAADEKQALQDEIAAFQQSLAQA